MKKYFDFIIYSFLYVVLIVALSMPIVKAMLMFKLYFFKDFTTAQRAIVSIAMQISTIIIFVLSSLLKKSLKNSNRIQYIGYISKKVTIIFTVIFVFSLINYIFVR